MSKSKEEISLPGVRLKPGPDDDLIAWRQRLLDRNVIISQRIKEAIRRDIERARIENDLAYALKSLNDRLGRIEAILQDGTVKQLPAEEAFNDEFLDGDL